jgi:hypothetical protein
MKRLCLRETQRATKMSLRGVPRHRDDEAISNDGIASPSARNDRLGVFSGEKYR